MSFVKKNLKTQKKGKIADCYTKWQDIIRVLKFNRNLYDKDDTEYCFV